MKNILTVLPGGRTYEYTEGTLLTDLLNSLDYSVEQPCGGRKTCGKCLIKVEGDNLLPPDLEEQALLSDYKLKDGFRLACHLALQGEVDVWIQKKTEIPIVTEDGHTRDIAFNPAMKRYRFTMPSSTLENNFAQEDLILKECSEINQIDLSALKHFPLIPKKQYIAHQYKNTLIAIEQDVETLYSFGVAVDIGTTTMIASLWNLSTGEKLAVASCLNSQKEIGLDVLTRIAYTIEQGMTGLAYLQKKLVDDINQLIRSLCKKANIPYQDIYDITVAANTTLTHILLGVPVESIGTAPFMPVFTTSKQIPAKRIGILSSKSAMLYTLPAIHSYVGGDITAGLYICQLNDVADKKILFIDIGTNGEMVLSSNRKMLSCSCAAGPALEGMNINCGMRAAKGAIESVAISNGYIICHTIGEEEPLGLCGSGLLSAISQLVKYGLILPNGRLQKKEALPTENKYKKYLVEYNGKKAIQLFGDICITQNDIRQVQLAKGAILSGIYALLNQANIKETDLDQILIAGQFGHHLTKESMLGCGLIPSVSEEIIYYVGNTAHNGAAAALLSLSARQEMENLAKKINYFELNTMTNYEMSFAKCLEFPT